MSNININNADTANINRAILAAERALHHAAIAQARELVPDGYVAATAALIKCCVSQHYVEPKRFKVAFGALTENELQALSPERRLAAYVYVANGGDAREWLDNEAARTRRERIDALVALGYPRERAEALDEVELGDALQRARDWADS